MEEITAYLTSDGKIFTEHAKAKRHAEARHADALLALARALSVLDKYCDTTAEYIDANLDKFLAVAALKNDIAIQKEPDPAATPRD
jgi:hypothetical protein